MVPTHSAGSSAAEKTLVLKWKGLAWSRFHAATTLLGTVGARTGPAKAHGKQADNHSMHW